MDPIRTSHDIGTHRATGFEAPCDPALVLLHACAPPAEFDRLVGNGRTHLEQVSPVQGPGVLAVPASTIFAELLGEEHRAVGPAPELPSGLQHDADLLQCYC